MLEWQQLMEDSEKQKKLLFTRSFGWINTSSTLGVLLPGNVVLVPSWTENLGILGFIYRKNFGCNGHTLWLNDTALLEIKKFGHLKTLLISRPKPT